MSIIRFLKGEKKIEGETEMKVSGSYEVTIPKERLVAADIRLNGKPYVCVLNESLTELSPKEPFRWYLSLILQYEKVVGDNMPDKEDTVKMQDFSDDLCKALTANKEHPNALFLGRVTGDGETQLMWYVNNPEKANDFLQSLILSGNYPFQFDFVIEPDPDWNEAHYWLDPLKQ